MQYDFGTSLAPKPEQMLQHLQFLFGATEYSDGMVELAWTLPQGGMTGRHYPAADLQAIATEAAAINAVQGQSVYIGGALRLPDTFPDGRAHDVDHYATTAIWVDLDTKEAAEAGTTRTSQLPPNLMVFTGLHPHPRIQMWWRLTEAITDQAAHRQVMGSIATHLDGDRTVVNPSRIMRLAGSIAWPKKAGRVAEMTFIGQPAAAAAPRYDLEQFLRIYPLVDNVVDLGASKASTDRARASGPLGLQGEIQDGREGYMRDTLLAVFVELVGTTGTCPTPQELFDEAWPQYSKQVDLSRPGRGPDEMSRKATYLVQRFEAGRLPGLPDLEAVVAEWNRKKPDPNPTAQEWSGQPREGTQQGTQGGQYDYSHWNAGQQQDGAQAQQEGTTAGQTGFGDDWGATKVGEVATSSPWGALDPDKIPARQWILPGFLIRRLLTVLAAPGGSGKSQLTVQAAIALAMGISWGGWRPSQRYRVLLVNAEDDMDEMQRRVVAACATMNVDPVHLDGWLILAEDPQSIVVARQDRNTGQIHVTELADKLLATIKAHQIDVVAADPFAETFEGDENSNSDVKWVAAIWRRIARESNASVLLVHHTAKGSAGKAGNADVVRGASALVNSARIVSTMFTMSEDEATLFGINPETCHRYVRYDDAKANLHLITGKARWFEKVSHTLANGDSVGALRPWAPPGAFDGVSVDTINRILDLINAGRQVNGQVYPYNLKPGPIANSNWAGWVVMNMISCERPQASKIIDEWFKSKLLVLQSYTNEKREQKDGVRVDNSKRPGGGF
jgi:hypothetical protein